MKIESCYGQENIPKLQISQGREKCPFCTKKHKKGVKTVYLAYNAGPTGRVVMCIKHAKKLSQEILLLVQQHNE